MAMPILVNPDDLDPQEYVEFLNRGFPGQWDRAAYDWYVARPFNGRPNDVLVAERNGTILAGLTICPRQIAIDDGPPIDVGVLSAGMTLPEERGRGLYPQLLEAALERARRHGYAALIGFVLADNASGRGLRRFGARAIGSFYLTSPARARACRAAPVRAARSGDSEATAALLTRRRMPKREGALLARFHYGDPADWRRQFIERPHAVRAVRLAHDSIALIESAGSTDRLQCLTCPEGKTSAGIAALTAASATAGRGFFMYTMDACEAAAARRQRLRVRDGYLLLQPTGGSRDQWQRLATARWQVQSGDRL
jgi:GNAT superfamily N-acetyltransferase